MRMLMLFSWRLVSYDNGQRPGNTPEAADPIPEPVELTLSEKLANAGISIDELKSALGI